MITVVHETSRNATLVTDETGQEIKGITAVMVAFEPNEPPVATIQLSLLNLDVAAHPLLSFDTVEAAAAFYGYDLVPRQMEPQVDVDL